MENESISVVIPAYNASAFLRQALASVLAQTVRAAEILVIDDGSTDGTAQVAESFPPPVRVIRRNNCGQSAARNFGVQHAAGEWIAFLDADDLWESDKLSRQLEEIAQTPNASLCYTARVQFSDNGGGVRLGNVLPVPPAAGIQEALSRNTTFLPSSVLIRRSAFLESGGFNSGMRYVEDWDLWMRLLRAGIVFADCQEALLLHRIHSGSMSHNAIDSLAAEKDVYRRYVLPHHSPISRFLRHQISQSGQEAAAAYVLRNCDDPRQLSMMATSLLRFPFNDSLRYKVLAHMLYMKVRSLCHGLR